MKDALVGPAARITPLNCSQAGPLPWRDAQRPDRSPTRRRVAPRPCVPPRELAPQLHCPHLNHTSAGTAPGAGPPALSGTRMAILLVLLLVAVSAAVGE